MTLWHLFKMQMQLWLMIGLPFSIVAGIAVAYFLRSPKKISVTEFRERLKKLTK